MERSIAREYSYFCKKETDEHMSQDEDVDKKENEEYMCPLVENRPNISGH
jgi:hypothetical protein